MPESPDSQLPVRMFLWRPWKSRWANLAFYAVLIGSVVGSTLVVIQLQGRQPSATSFAPVIAAGCLFVFALVSVERRPPGDSESRRRVLDAEHELEEALRAHPPVPGQGGVDQGEVPHQRVPASAETALVLPELWKVTHSRLDHYHETVLGQARRSFRSAQLAMWLGFLLLVAFVSVAVRASSTAGAVVAGGLGAVSAALAGYVGRTFMKSQEAASAHLRAYFEQPLAFSRYLAAERLLRNSHLEGAARGEVVAALVLAVADVPGTGSTGRREGAVAESRQTERSPTEP
ncbi:hypothetical protein [Streptomyces sp. NPDC004579]|uniref:hypothetical protein n=1 Tax=Streptomyces sp. NPDC004579 TaxID=3154667 RepID=UPI0033A0CC62